MRRAEQKSYCKSGVNWQGAQREPQRLAASIVVFTLPDEMVPDNLALGSFTQERYFEAMVCAEAARYQKEVLEADPRYQKPTAPVVAEPTPFVGVEKFQTFEEWLAKQSQDGPEEIELDTAA